MSIDQDIANSARQLEADVKINHQITHGGDTVEVPTEGGPVPSIRKRLKDIETEWAKTADPLASELEDVVQVTRDYKEAAAASAETAHQSESNAGFSAEAARVSWTKAKEAEQGAKASEAAAKKSESSAASSALGASSDADAAAVILDQIGVTVVALSTSLIRTQTAVSENHAFK